MRRSGVVVRTKIGDLGILPANPIPQQH